MTCLGLSVQSSLLVQSKAERLTYPLRRYSPVLLQESDITHAECPAKLATCSPEEVSYNTITFESPAAARNFPAGEKATVRTGFTNPVLCQLLHES